MGSVGRVLSGDISSLWKNDDTPPPIPPLPAPVEEVDVAGQRAYTKSRLRNRKGRQSTILASGALNPQTQKKTVLG